MEVSVDARSQAGGDGWTYMIAIIDFHPLRRTMSKRIHKEITAATPMEIAEMTVNARGGLYAMSRALIFRADEVKTDLKNRGTTAGSDGLKYEELCGTCTYEVLYVEGPESP